LNISAALSLKTDSKYYANSTLLKHEHHESFAMVFTWKIHVIYDAYGWTKGIKHGAACGPFRVAGDAFW